MAKLTVIGPTGCGGGTCPTVYETENGTIVVQGYVVNASDFDLELPPGETAVELPRSLLERTFGAKG